MAERFGDMVRVWVYVSEIRWEPSESDCAPVRAEAAGQWTLPEEAAVQCVRPDGVRNH